MKRIILTIFLAASPLLAGAQSSLWLFSSDHIDAVKAQWTGENHAVTATEYGDGTLDITRGDESYPALKYYMKKKSPCLDGLRDGDSWEFSVPVKQLPAGTYVEFDMSLVAEEASPRYYVIEYLDGGEWKTMPLDLREEDGVTYSFKSHGYVTTPTYQYTTVLQTVRLENPVTDGTVKVRARVAADIDCRGRRLDSASDKCCTRIEWGDNVGAYLNVLGTEAPKDTTSILCIGNSFTYVHGASWMLKEMAWSEGHYLAMKDALKGGQTFGEHLGLVITDEAVRFGGYDVAVLQNQSQTPALYAQDPKDKASIMKDAVTLTDRIRGYSPDVRVIMESTWAYPGSNIGGFSSVKEFDKLLAKGTKAMAKETDCDISPIGRAFAVARAERPDIPMYGKDDKHQSKYGAYLKACVNYLVIFGTAFDGNVSDCHVEHDKAEYLRSVAMKIVKTK